MNPRPSADDIESSRANYMTPEGFRTLRDELERLARVERPRVVEVITWAAGNGDRSENGDYIYSKRRLREIDRRIRYLTKRLENAEVVDPARQTNLTRVFFGATVDCYWEDGTEQRLKIVGEDEADAALGKISFHSPVARALLRAEAGDLVTVTTPQGRSSIEILAICYTV